MRPLQGDRWYSEFIELLSNRRMTVVGCHAVSIYMKYSIGMRFFQNDRGRMSCCKHLYTYSLGMRPLQGDRWYSEFIELLSDRRMTER
ncbi:MAG: hypothetical protein LC105_10345, partial [Chitinophagales bacterium]|nr:hypothetical protein [Chitinophagales bacterium]